MSHTHPIVDSDLHFTINSTDRTITNASNKVKLIQYDHNSERFTFECPRFIEGHDMSLCNSVKVLYINLDKSTREEACGVYLVDDLTTESDESNTIKFSWLISRNATEHVGTLSFLIQFACMSEEGNTEYVWHTDIYKGIKIVTGMESGEAIIEEYPDILEQWKNDILAEIPKLAPQVVKKIESLDKDNPAILRDLDSGSYVLYGRFKPYAGSDATMTFSSELLVNVIKRTADSHIQIFYPYNNCVQYLKINYDNYERKNIYLNDLATIEYVDQKVPTDEETLQELVDADAISAVSINGEILTDGQNNVLMM